MESSQIDVTEPRSPSEPAWVGVALLFLPAPVFAWTVVAACVIATGIFLVQALIHQEAVYWVLVGILTGTAIVVSVATVIRRRTGLSTSELARYQSAERKPTFAIITLLTAIYSWMLMIGIHIFEGFFRNGPGTTKYYVTLAIAVASSVYVRWRGMRIIRDHFGNQGRRGVWLTPKQAVVVIVFGVGCGLYGTWLMI